MNRYPIIRTQAEEERDLVRRLKERDSHAMAEIYSLYGRLVYIRILRIVRNQSIAEDLTQETFLRIWNGVRSYDEERAGLGTWIAAVARNQAIDYLRSGGGRMARKEDRLGTVERSAAYSDPVAGICNLDRTRALSLALKGLTAKQRVVIDLSYREGLSQAEIAGRLRQPLGTVKTRVRTALQSMRARLVQPEYAAL